MGGIGILNVGAGDTKLSFDKANPAECIRAGRIVTDMLRRGYALLIEVPDGKGGKSYVRAKAFDEATSEYIIADFDPETAAKADREENERSEPPAEGPRESPEASSKEPGEATSRKGRRNYLPTQRVAADSTSGVAVARSAGG